MPGQSSPLERWRARARLIQRRQPRLLQAGCGGEGAFVACKQARDLVRVEGVMLPTELTVDAGAAISSGNRCVRFLAPECHQYVRNPFT